MASTSISASSTASRNPTWRANARNPLLSPRSTVERLSDRDRSMRILPSAACADLNDERYGELDGLLHLRADQLLRFGDLLLRRFEDQLVVDLEEQARSQVSIGERLRHARHGGPGDVGGGALDRRVDRDALAGLRVDRAPAEQLGDESLATEQRAHPAVLLRRLDRPIAPGAHAGVELEVARDEGVGLLLGDAEDLRERDRALAVDRGEVDGLGDAALLGGDVALGDAEELARGAAVDVDVLLKRIHQQRIAGEVSQDAELDLVPIGGDQHVSGRSD